MAARHRYDRARRLLALFHAAAIRADRRSGTFVTQFAGTSAVSPGTVTSILPPIAERSNYYDFGVQQKLLEQYFDARCSTVSMSSLSILIDEGQFGAPIILTPFNYRYGFIGGVEFSANYTVKNFSAYANLSFQAAHGKDVESSQFNFDAAQLAYIAENYIHLDHEGRVAASAGASYLWAGTRFSADMLFGTGLRQDLTLPQRVLLFRTAITRRAIRKSIWA
jgi:outer membrane receptor for ferrienterochelin and colicins